MYSIFDTEQVENFRKEYKRQPYRIKQIYKEIFHNAVIDFNEMTTLPKDMRKILIDNFSIVPLELHERIDDAQTSKFLFKTKSGHIMESVLMYHFHTEQRTQTKKLNRMTLCISSQV